MTKKSVTSWFGQHAVEVSIGVLVIVTLGAWTNQGLRINTLSHDVRTNYATMDYVNTRVDAINDNVARELRTIVVSLAEVRAAAERGNGIIASRLQDIGDRLARIEGEMKGTRP